MSRPSQAVLNLLFFFLSAFTVVALDRGAFDRIYTRGLLGSSPIYLNFTSVPQPASRRFRTQPRANVPKTPLTVGIIGAGAAGLYSAILLESLGIECEILEADKQAGGRIRTHYFNEETWKKSRPGEPDYYDYVVSEAPKDP